MSHFSVLVIGENVEAQLAPFHEFECTGVDDQHVQTVDVTEEARKEYDSGTCREPFAEWAAGWYGSELLDEGTEPDLAGAHKYGYIVVRRQTKPETVSLGRFTNLDDDEAAAVGAAELRSVEVVAIFDRTNPWDWWVIGGRWNNFLRLKPEVAAQRENLVLVMCGESPGASDHLHTNQAKKGDVDFEAMRNETGEEARERWQKAAVAIAGRPVPVWKDMVDALGEKPTREQIDALRKEYHASPVIQDLWAAEFYFDAEEYAASEEDYVAQARDQAICTFAVVKDSTWYEKGSIGLVGHGVLRKGRGRVEPAVQRSARQHIGRYSADHR